MVCVNPQVSVAQSRAPARSPFMLSGQSSIFIMPTMPSHWWAALDPQAPLKPLVNTTSKARRMINDCAQRDMFAKLTEF